jgi:tryptophanyl-tRNA synthetase
MSKSAPADAPGVIRMLDSSDDIRRKVRRAVTDSDNELRYDPLHKPGLSNLAEIVSSVVGLSPHQVLDQHTSYRQLKDACADAIVGELDPIRRRHDELMDDPAELRRTLVRGAERAADVAEPVLQRAREAMGVVTTSLCG